MSTTTDTSSNNSFNSIPQVAPITPLTGKPTIDRPWMKYYPPQIAQMHIPGCTLLGYLHENCSDESLTAIHFYGEDISWTDIFTEVDQVARSLKAIGFGIGDQIPTLLQNVPEFYTLLLGAEKIGASVMCRDNTLEENAEAVEKSGAKVIFTHDYLSKEALDTYLSLEKVEKVVLIPPFNRGSYDATPSYIQRSVDALYPAEKAEGPATMSWKEFLALGEDYTGTVEAPVDVNRPLYRAYTSGSTGPSKQVIHSAYTMIGIIHQMNFYGVAGSVRLTWMETCLPPALVASVVSMVLMPLASDRLLYLDPFCDSKDVDLELMRYKPNG